MSNSTIRALKAREILDSRGNPTVEVEVLLDCGTIGRAAVPSGASTGAHEAVELRDGDKKRYLGKGTQTAVRNVLDGIAPAVVGMSVFDQVAHRLEDDRTRRHAEQGPTRGQRDPRRLAGRGPRRRQARCGNRSIATSAAPTPACCPVPMMNILNGGKHADNTVDFQEFMIMPVGAPTFREGLRMGAEVFHSLKKVLHDKGLNTAVGDEGGFAPNIASADDALATIATADREGRLQARRAGRASRSTRPAPNSTRKPNTAQERRLLLLQERPEEGHLLRRDDRPLGETLRQVPDPLHRGRPRGRRLGRLEEAHREARRQGATRRRRPVRHQHRTAQARHRGRVWQQHPGEGEPDRHADRNARRRRDWPSGTSSPRS